MLSNTSLLALPLCTTIAYTYAKPGRKVVNDDNMYI